MSITVATSFNFPRNVFRNERFNSHELLFDASLCRVLMRNSFNQSVNLPVEHTLMHSVLQSVDSLVNLSASVPCCALLCCATKLGWRQRSIHFSTRSTCASILLRHASLCNEILVKAERLGGAPKRWSAGQHHPLRYCTN